MADVEQIRRAGLDTQRTADQAVLGVGSNTDDIIEKGDPVFQIAFFFRDRRPDDRGSIVVVITLATM